MSSLRLKFVSAQFGFAQLCFWKAFRDGNINGYNTNRQTEKGDDIWAIQQFNSVSKKWQVQNDVPSFESSYTKWFSYLFIKLFYNLSKTQIREWETANWVITFGMVLLSFSFEWQWNKSQQQQEQSQCLNQHPHWSKESFLPPSKACLYFANAKWH